MAGRTIAEAATERETLTRDPLMWHGTIVTQDRLCSEMLATFRMSRAKSGLSTNGPIPVIRFKKVSMGSFWAASGLSGFEHDLS